LPAGCQRADSDGSSHRGGPLKRHAIEHGTVDATPAAPTFAVFVRDQFVPLVMPAYTAATRERYTRLLWKESVVAALGQKRLNEIGAREFRALDAAVRSRGEPSPASHHRATRA
jgi:hypothetical protein